MDIEVEYRHTQIITVDCSTKIRTDKPSKTFIKLEVITDEMYWSERLENELIEEIKRIRRIYEIKSEEE